MYETVQYLTEIYPPRNHKNLQSLNKVADYIWFRFKKIGLEVTFQEFEVNGKVYKNIIATLNPQYVKRVLFGGHYDVCGDIAGADDNASAVAGIIESARQLYAHKEDLNFRVDFIAYVLEEPPYFNTPHMGSYVHAKSLKDAKIDIMGLINYEMIGYFTDEPNSQKYPLEEMESVYPSRGNYIAIMSNESSTSFLKDLNLTGIQSKLPVHEIIFPDSQADIAASDQLNYWNLGFNAIMVTDTAYFRNKNYHTVDDTIETLDFETNQSPKTT